jgi:hypothetical protein
MRELEVQSMGLSYYAGATGKPDDQRACRSVSPTRGPLKGPPSVPSNSAGFLREDRRGSAKKRFAGGIKSAEPMEMPHVLRFSSLSDAPSVSTALVVRRFCNSPYPLKFYNFTGIGSAAVPVRRAASAAPDSPERSEKNVTQCKSLQRGAASRCESASELPIIWRLRQFPGAVCKQPAQTPLRTAARRRLRKRVSQIGQVAIGARPLLAPVRTHRDR